MSRTPDGMKGDRAEAEGPALLASLLEQFVAGQYDLWQQVAGRRELLRGGLRQAIREAASSPDVAVLLERCWELLTDDRTALRVAEFYRRDPDYEQVPVDHERVLLGALKLLATAQVAVAALQVGAVPDAAGRLDHWSRVATERFGMGDQPPQHPLGSEPVENPTERVRRAYRRLGGRAGGALFWTLDWLDATSAIEVVKVPVIGYHGRVGGFCADLRLRLIQGEGELVEHPDMALRPLGPELRDVILEACQAATPGRGTTTGSPGRRSVCWSLTVRDRNLDPLVPLDGGSLSGAARAGLLLLRAGHRYNPRAVIVAKAGAGGELRPVGFERDKLEAASASGLRRAIVAPGAALSEGDRDDLAVRGLKLHKAPDIPSALKLVRARRRPLPITLAAASGVVTIVALLFLLVGPLTDHKNAPRSNRAPPSPEPSGAAPASSPTFLPDLPPADGGLKYISSADPGPGVWDDRWHHVAATYDNARRMAKLFLDGAEVGSGSHASADIVYGLPTTDDLYIGAYGNKACPQAFVGDLDEITVWNRALSPDEVALEARQQGQVDPSSGLAAQWHFDEGAGEVVVDASGKGNNGRWRGGEPLSWVDGRLGTALRFTGTNSVMVPDSPTLASQDVTIEAWVRAKRSPGDSRYLLGKGANGCNASSYGLYTGATGGLISYIANDIPAAPLHVRRAISFDPSDCGLGRQSSSRYFHVKACMRHNSEGFTAAVIVQNATSVSRMVWPTAVLYFASRDGSDRAEQGKGQVQRTVTRPGDQVTYTVEGPSVPRCAGIQARIEIETDPPSLWASSPFKDQNNHRCPSPGDWNSGALRWSRSPTVGPARGG
jgi:hypothetical protein